MKKFFRYPWLIIGMTLALTGFLGYQILFLALDNDVTRFIPEEDPSRVALEKVDELFGSQIMMMVGLEAPDSSIFTPQRLQAITTLTQEIEAMPEVDSVLSLSNTDYLWADGEEIKVDPLIDLGFSGGAEEILELRSRLLGWNLYHRSLVSDDFTSTSIVVNLKEIQAEMGEEDPKAILYDNIMTLLEETDLHGMESHLAGTPAISALMSKNMQADLRILIPLVLLILILVLYLSFRRMAGILLPLITVMISTLWTLGLMSFLGITLTMIGTIIPVLMIAVGSAYGIHVISHYLDDVAHFKGDWNRQANESLIFSTLKKVGRPVMLAGLTTVAGFFSLSFTTIIPMRTFGIFTSVGVVGALLIALTFLPALLLIFPPRKNTPGALKAEAKEEAEDAGIQKFLKALFHKITSHKIPVLLASGLLILVSLWGLSQLVVDNALVDYFKEDTVIGRADEFLREKLGGTKTFSLVVRSPERGGMNNPQALGVIDDLGTLLEESFPEVQKTMSYTHLIKRLNQIFHQDESPLGLERKEEQEDLDLWSFSSGGFGEEEEEGFGFGDDDFGFFEEEAEAEAQTQSLEKNTLPRISSEEQALMDRIWNDWVSQDHRLVSWSEIGPEYQEIWPEGWGEFPSGEEAAYQVILDVARNTNYRGFAYYEIPQDPEKYGWETAGDLEGVIGNLLFLLSSGLENWADDSLEPSQVRMMVQMNTKGNMITKDVEALAGEYLDENLPEGYSYEFAGMAQVEVAITDLIVGAQSTSILMSMVFVLIILTLYFRSPWAGLLGIIPLSVSILINFGLMGFLGINLDMSTAMVASIAIGIGIDYTIHFLSAYHRFASQGESHEEATLHTYLTSGKAILFNAFSVGLGFGVLAFSQFRPLTYMGLLISLTMFTASFGALTILPGVLGIFKPGFMKKPWKSELENEGGKA